MENSLEDVKASVNDMSTSKSENDGKDGETIIRPEVEEEAGHESAQSSMAFHQTRTLVDGDITASNNPAVTNMTSESASFAKSLPGKEKQCWADSHHEGDIVGEKVATSTTKVKEGDGANQVSCYRKGRWDGNEHDMFLIAHYIHGKQWHKFSSFIPTRTAAQVKNHAQKYFEKVKKQLVLRKNIDKKKGASWRINYATTIPDDELSLVALSFMKVSQGWTPKTMEEDLRAKTIVNKFINNHCLGDNEAIQSILGCSQNSPSTRNRKVKGRKFLRPGQLLASSDANHAARLQTPRPDPALPQVPFSVSSIPTSHDSRWTDYVQSILDCRLPNPPTMPPESVGGTSFGSDLIDQQSQEGGSPGFGNITAASRGVLTFSSVNPATLMRASPPLAAMASPPTSGLSMPLAPQESPNPEISAYRYNPENQRQISGPLYATAQPRYGRSRTNDHPEVLNNQYGRQPAQWSVAHSQARSQSRQEQHDHRNTNENNQEQPARNDEYELLLQQQRLLQQQSSCLQAYEDMYIALLQRNHGLDLRSDWKPPQNPDPPKNDNDHPP